MPHRVDTRSLYRFAVCAEEENALPLARASLERVANLDTSMSYYCTCEVTC